MFVHLYIIAFNRYANSISLQTGSLFYYILTKELHNTLHICTSIKNSFICENYLMACSSHCSKTQNYMGFTWIHLNQVNVGTNVAVGCASYRWWCTLTGVSTCTTVNTCTKHKKRCSKGKPLYIYSTYTKDKRI